MAEFDTVNIFNPLKEEFTARWNGEPYTLKAGERRTFPTFLAIHIAKHLSDKCLAPQVEAIKKEQTDNPYRPAVAQLMVYDNPKRRIALYTILGSKELVEQAVNASGYKGFVGNMSEYDDFVASTTTKKVQETMEVADQMLTRSEPVEETQETEPVAPKTRGRKKAE